MKRQCRVLYAALWHQSGEEFHGSDWAETRWSLLRQGGFSAILWSWKAASDCLTCLDLPLIFRPMSPTSQNTLQSIHLELQKLWPFWLSLPTLWWGSGSLSGLMIHSGAPWHNLCNYSLFHELALSLSLSHFIVSVTHPHSSIFDSPHFSFPPLFLWSTLLLLFVFVFLSILFFSTPLSLSPSPSFPRPLCLPQINYPLIYAQLSSEEPSSTSTTPTLGLSNGAASFSAWCSS